MTVKELIEKLKEFDENMEVGVVYDQQCILLENNDITKIEDVWCYKTMNLSDVNEKGKENPLIIWAS